MTKDEAARVIRDFAAIEAWVSRRHGARAATKLRAGPGPRRVSELWAGIATESEDRFWAAAHDARRAAEALGYTVREAGGYTVNEAAVSLSAGLSAHERLAAVARVEAALRMAERSGRQG